MSRRDETEPPKATESETTKDDNNVIPPEPLKVVYCDTDVMSLEELRQNFFKDKKVELQDFEELTITGPKELVTIERTDDIPEKLTFTLRNKEYTAVFDIAYYADSTTTNEILKSYTKYARYKIEGTERGALTYRVATKSITRISDLSNFPLYFNGCSEEEIIELAYQDIKSIYGEEVLSKYRFRVCSTTGNKRMIGVLFDRFIGDYSMESNFLLNYNGMGELVEIANPNLGKFDFAEHLLTEKKLKEVEKEANELMDGRLVTEKYLVIHNDGYLCVQYHLVVGYNKHGDKITTLLYYRVE
jgi:hypothetical protein